MAGYTIRRATAADARFLADMLVEAANWNEAAPRPRVAVLEDVEIARYISGWRRPGDIGAVAVDELGGPIGGVWARVFAPDAAGSGFVATGVPEVTLGVNRQWRAQGIGRDLLHAIASLAREAGHTRLSLSVDRRNFAYRLYTSEGYQTVASGDRADVMVRALH
ncbi:MAG TPA: GNAT family N-acetyltransferase [Humibacter sp.]|nr:GNAT family N-acetyltransferase [Humibacter sp.]